MRKIPPDKSCVQGVCLGTADAAYLSAILDAFGANEVYLDIERVIDLFDVKRMADKNPLVMKFRKVGDHWSIVSDADEESVTKPQETKMEIDWPSPKAEVVKRRVNDFEGSSRQRPRAEAEDLQVEEKKG